MKFVLVGSLLCLAGGFLIAGCASSQSPTASLVRGDIEPDEYLSAVKKANEQARADDEFNLNKEPTRAYNTTTGKFEYVPKDTQQFWNEKTQRWEFTPVTR